MNSKKVESITRRRFRHIGIFLSALALALSLVWLQHNSLGDTGFSTGYVLLGAVVFLALYSLRKRLSVLRFLGSSSAWLHLHIYIALGSFVFFLVHIGFRIPQGPLEQLLAVMFVMISSSGVYGLYITRVYPKRLTATKQEYIFEQLPVQQRALMLEAKQIVLQASTQSDTLTDFYMSRLLPFFTQSRSLWYLAFPTGRTRRELMQDLRKLDRYLALELRPSAMSLGRLVQKKDDMDFHFALQGKLKLWLFFHIGCTYALLVLAALHTVLAHAFDGGLR